jgi:hypothetical protein
LPPFSPLTPRQAITRRVRRRAASNVRALLSFGLAHRSIQPVSKIVRERPSADRTRFRQRADGKSAGYNCRKPIYTEDIVDSSPHNTSGPGWFVAASVVLAILLASGSFLQAQTTFPVGSDGPPSGWFGDGASMIAVVRPTNFYWFVTTATGACPPGFTFGANSDGLPHCNAQFGLFNDVPLPGYYSQGVLLEAAVWRPSDQRLYFQPATGVCPAGSANLGRLASGAVYCSLATIVQPGMTPVSLKRRKASTIVGGWDSIRQTWVFPAISRVCPVGTVAANGRCELRRGNSSITPRVLDYDGDSTDDIGYYDPRGGKHHFVPSSRTCPKGSLRDGTANGTVGCLLVPSAGQVALAPGDYDGDRIPDVVNYDVARHRFSLVPTRAACPWAFTRVADDVSGRVTCALVLGAGQDIPVEQGDYDKDGRVDAAVVNETTYVWTILPSSGNCPAFTTPVTLSQGWTGCTRQ